jgi:probable HAF family extracellular repeat protein
MSSPISTSIRRRLAAIVAGAVVFAALAVANSQPASAAPPPKASIGSSKGSSIRSPGFLLDNGRYTTIQARGARTHTYAHGINNRGQIAGGFDDPSFDGPDGRGHGSIREKNGRFVQFDVPGAISTLANKINDRGQVVGGTNDSNISVGAPGTKGFLFHRGKLTTIDVPGSIETQALGINNHGRVVGEYVDADGTFHGFLWHKGRFTTIDGPGSLGGVVTDINDRGQMVGTYLDPDGTYRGFLLSKGVYTTFAAPDAPFTFAFDINNRRQIVGSGLSYDADGNLTSARGFVLRIGPDGPFTPIDYPGALGTIARGIDDRGRIVGLYGNPDAAPSTARTRAQLPPLLPRLPLGLGDREGTR